MNQQVPSSGAPLPRPLGLAQSLLLFGVPALALILLFHFLMPALIQVGILPFYAYSLSFLILFIGLIVAALVGYRVEGHPLDWTSFADRFRLRRMNPRDWAWTGLGFLAALALLLAVQPLSMWLIRSGLMPIPATLPRFLDPRVELTGDLYAGAAGGVKGNWLFLLTSLVLLCLNVLGEELWWRGYILPRQEEAFGRWTWIVHGLLWTAFHAAMWWNLLNLLPLTLGLVFIATRRASTTVGLITHTFHKLDFFIVTLPLFLRGVAGS